MFPAPGRTPGPPASSWLAVRLARPSRRGDAIPREAVAPARERIAPDPLTAAERREQRLGPTEDAVLIEDVAALLGRPTGAGGEIQPRAARELAGGVVQHV